MIASPLKARPEGRALVGWPAVIVGVAVFVGAFFLLPGQVVRKKDFPEPPGKADVLRANNERLSRENDVRTTAVQALGGMALLLGLFFTYRTFRLTRDGQITERFSQAIEYLGSDKPPTRLGAIYALERIARISRYDHAIVVETLVALLHERSPRSATASRRKPPADAQAVITVLGRRRREFDTAEERLQLRELDLRGLVFDDGDFRMTDFRGSELAGAGFASTHLEGAWFQEAGLIKAVFNGARCKGAKFDGAHLDNAETSAAKDLDSANAHCGPGIGSH